MNLNIRRLEVQVFFSRKVKIMFPNAWTLQQCTVWTIALLVILFSVLTSAAYSESSTISTPSRDARVKGSLSNIFQRNWSFSPTGRCKLNEIYLTNNVTRWSNYNHQLLVLSLFTVVQWGQSLCQAPSGEYGSCVPNNECVARGGVAGGPCAEGYGMCCVCELE